MLQNNLRRALEPSYQIILRSLFDTSTNSHKRLKSLSLSFPSAYVDSKVLERSKILEHLQQLRLDFQGFVDDQSNHTPANSGFQDFLRTLLVAAPNLRSLDTIGQFITEPAPRGRARYDAERLFAQFGSNTWHHLSSLSLEVVSTTADNLLEFFSRHAGTIRILRVCLLTIQHEPGITICSILSKLHKTLLRLEDVAFLRAIEVRDQDCLYTHHELMDYPEMTVRRALRYLFCGQTTDEFGEADDLNTTFHNWNSLTIEDVERRVRVVL